MEQRTILDEYRESMTAYLKKTIKEKGWMVKEVAERWKVSPRRMSQMLSNPNDRLIDGIHGLPKKS